MIHKLKQDYKNMPSNNLALCRIAKYIALAGVCSRRAAEELIIKNRVKVDGKTIISPALNVSSQNVIEIDGQIIKLQEKIRIWLYYKPVGLITTHKDPHNRPTVFDSLKEALPRVISVGRLDLNSEGLLLLTNNGAFANKYESPKSNIDRVYKVRAYGKILNLMNSIQDKKIDRIIAEGIIYKPKSIQLISTNKMNSWFVIILNEGKNREIRKIFEHFGLSVNRLIRTKYGKYELGNLKPGEFKEVLP